MTENPDELQPWVILEGDSDSTRLALWRMEQDDAEAIALFSDEQLAKSYAEENCGPSFNVRRLERIAMVRVFADAYRSGIQYATLNPTSQNARQIFIIKDVLAAARTDLDSERQRRG